MNNQQFRRLLQPSSTQSSGDTPSRSDGTPSTVKRSALIPMTPRNVKGGNDVDFARQVRERNASFQPSKKFKSAAPKGVKIAAGYTDRAKVRAETEDAHDDKGERIKALEEQMKLGQISQEAFESLRDEITGGDVASTHLVKGLDRRLLERVRRGEDVLGTNGGSSDEQASFDVDEELQKLEKEDVQAMQRETVQKKGNMAPPPPRAGVKRSRDDIMAELKAQRQAAAEAKAGPSLDANKWRKVGDKTRRVEIDHKGREVLITVDEDGIVKKKVRKVPAKKDDASSAAMEMPDPSKPILGADAILPTSIQARDELSQDDDEDNDDDDIFEGVGTEYNPLGDDGSGDDESEEEGDTSSKPKHTDIPPAIALEEPRKNQEPTAEVVAAKPAAAPRNYFKENMSTTEEEPKDRLAGVEDFLKKAAKLDSERFANHEDGDEREDEEQKARLRKRVEMLGERDRDLEDMDMGFGESRFGDAEEEGDGKRTRLSEWKGGADGGWEENEKTGDKKKRKPKKRKGDSNNMSDIMRVIEGRKSNGK